MQRVSVFQQKGSGERKIEAVREHGSDMIVLEVISIDDELPDIVEDSSPYLPADLDTDLVLDFLTHRDLSHDLAALCAAKSIPMIASGKKLTNKWVLTPPT